MEKETKIKIIQLVLLVVTLITTTIAGAEWIFGKSIYALDERGSMTFNSHYSFSDFASGLPFSMAFILILSVHEFGHYITARIHKIRTSLPYYIPLPPFPLMLGTLGALIRIRQRIPTTTKNFDVGIAGPLAGFVAALIILSYGFINLPPPEYIFQIHPEYKQFGLNYPDHVYSAEFLKGGADIIMGNNLLFQFLASWLADPIRMPNGHEVMHYPFLFAGYLSLVFTALNLMPIGQLDGGHVVYGLFGAKGHRWIASIVFITFVFFAGLGIIQPGKPIYFITEIPFPLTIPVYVAFLYFICKGLGLEAKNTIIVSLSIFLSQYLLIVAFPKLNGFNGWLLFAFLLGRFVGVRHPGADIEEPLSPERKVLGWIALIILVLCFTPTPIEIISYEPTP